jgi:hypothetical protein
MTLTHTDVLLKAFGHDIILTESSHESTVYRIVAEFVYESTQYAVLQSDQQKKDDDVSLFKVIHSAQEPFLELESIQDEDEWETVSELYDEMTFLALHPETEADELK